MKNKIKFILVIVIITAFSLIYKVHIVSSQSKFTYSYSFNHIENKDIQKVNQWIHGIKDDSLHVLYINDDNNKKSTLYIYSRKFNSAEIELNEKTLMVKAIKSSEKQYDSLIINVKYNPEKVEIIKFSEK